jgi:hypothetical protein
MTKSEFEQRFGAALEEAATIADEQLGRNVPRRFRVKLYGAGHRGDIVCPPQAVDALYLGADVYFCIIDFAVIEVGPGSTIVFVRASDHTSARWDQTWNTPPGSGPFKQLVSASIRETKPDEGNITPLARS